jgi:hypothetical protein
MLRRVALTAAIALSVSTAIAGDAAAPGAPPVEARSAALRPSLEAPPTDGHSCTGLDRTMAMVEAVGGRNFQFLDGDAATVGAELFNATPPVSQDAWPLVALVDGPDGTGSILVGKGAEICGRVNFTSDLWPRLVERLLGRRA